MKVFILLAMALVSYSGSAFSQCPAPGMKIQSAACEDPGNLQVTSVTCSEIKVKWTGHKSQQYLVKATGIEQSNDVPYEAKVSQVSCNEDGSCAVTIAVKQGSVVSWTVQTVCSMQGAAVYSAEVNGEDAYVANCLKAENSIGISAIHVFPNPANDYLMVQYDGKTEGSTDFKIYDITGKTMLGRLGASPAKSNNQFRIDVRKLPPGAYLLESINGSNVNKTKFILLRN